MSNVNMHDSHEFSNVKALAGLVKSQAQNAEANSDYSTAVINALHDIGVFKRFLPIDGPVTPLALGCVIELLEETSRQDGSFGWLTMTNLLGQVMFSLFLPEKGYKEVFSPTYAVNTAGQYYPNGQGTAVKNGFIVSGNWRFGTGIEHADWVMGGFVPIKDGIPGKLPNGAPDVRIAVMHKSEVEVESGWNVTGLKATGSFNYNAIEIFVPEHRIMEFHDPKMQREGPLPWIGVMPFAACLHGGWALGLARYMLEEMANLARYSSRGSEMQSIARKMTFQDDYARAVVKLRAAKVNLITAAEELASTDSPSNRQVAEVRLAAVFATDIAKEISDICLRHLGTVASRQGSEFSRALLDIRVGMAHTNVSETVYSDSGKTLLEL